MIYSQQDDDLLIERVNGPHAQLHANTLHGNAAAGAHAELATARRAAAHQLRSRQRRVMIIWRRTQTPATASSLPRRLQSLT